MNFFSYQVREQDNELLRTFGVMGEQISRVFERRKAREELEVAERQNRLLLDSAGEGIYGLDLDGNTTFVNPAAAKMLGYEPDELLGKPMHLTIHHAYPDGSSYPREKCPIYAAFSDGKIYRVNDEVLWRKDGTSFYTEYVSTPLYNNDEISGAVVYV